MSCEEKKIIQNWAESGCRCCNLNWENSHINVDQDDDKFCVQGAGE